MAKKNTNTEAGLIVINKKARFNHELLSFVEAGICLTGSEIKSLREKRANLTDSYAKIRKGEIFLYSFHITPYKNGGYANHVELRPRKLLLKRKEIDNLERKVKEKGYVIVALKSYFKNNKYVKVELALAKPKKLYDKRDDMQSKEAKIEIQRALKNRNERY
jgi:SsrA-binding protein